MLNQNVCSLSATTTDSVILLVTARADGFLQPFVKSLLLQCAGHRICFERLFCFSWSNTPVDFGPFDIAMSGKSSYPLENLRY